MISSHQIHPFTHEVFDVNRDLAQTARQVGHDLEPVGPYWSLLILVGLDVLKEAPCRAARVGAVLQPVVNSCAQLRICAAAVESATQ